ncbi:hypothetical protein [Muricoccus radiodurans]|uniref:hypothetical protein n=1 Tax=Muricoccus radiodurans TaxID=2231721 RepID=UPI003CED9D52
MSRPPLDVEALYPQLREIRDDSLREGVVAVFQELWALSQWDDIGALPVSWEIPYPNLPHTQCIVTMAIAVADALVAHHGTTIDRDLLIAGAILQDASKLVEYEPGPDGKGRHTEIGKQYLHGFWCAHLAAQRGLPHALSHIIMTHGSGSPKFPDSIEGKILYYVDQLDVIAVYKDRFKKHLMISK